MPRKNPRDRRGCRLRALYHGFPELPKVEGPAQARRGWLRANREGLSLGRLLAVAQHVEIGPCVLAIAAWHFSIGQGIGGATVAACNCD